MLRGFSLGLKFAVELAAFAALAFWGASTSSGALSVALAIAAPGLAILAWGRWAAPQSQRRLPTTPRIALELSVFALAVAALFAAGADVAAVVLAVLVATSTALLSGLRQWES